MEARSAAMVVERDPNRNSVYGQACEDAVGKLAKALSRAGDPTARNWYSMRGWNLR